MAKKINVVYFDNHDFDFDEYKDFYMEDNEISDPNEVEDNDIWSYIDDSLNSQFDDFIDNLFYSKNNNDYWCISGNLGLWVGCRSIEPIVCDELTTAIKKCIGNCEYWSIKQVNGHLEVDAYHHDGCNSFRIDLLNDKGIDAFERIREGYGNADLSKRTYHRAMKGYLY